MGLERGCQKKAWDTKNTNVTSFSSGQVAAGFLFRLTLELWLGYVTKCGTQYVAQIIFINHSPFFLHFLFFYSQAAFLNLSENQRQYRASLPIPLQLSPFATQVTAFILTFESCLKAQLGETIQHTCLLPGKEPCISSIRSCENLVHILLTWQTVLVEVAKGSAPLLQSCCI